MHLFFRQWQPRGLFYRHSLNPAWNWENHNLLCLPCFPEATGQRLIIWSVVEAGTILFLSSQVHFVIHTWPSTDCVWVFSSTTLWISQVQGSLPQTLLNERLQMNYFICSECKTQENAASCYFSIFLKSSPCSSGLWPSPRVCEENLDRPVIACWKWKARPTVASPCVTCYWWCQH